MPDLCRLCLIEIDASINIFDPKAVHLLIKAIECLQLSINHEDGLPSTICENCAHNVYMFHAFWERAKKCDEYLRKSGSVSNIFDTEGLSAVDEVIMEVTYSPNEDEKSLIVHSAGEQSTETFIVPERPNMVFVNQVSVINECGTPKSSSTEVIRSVITSEKKSFENILANERCPEQNSIKVRSKLSYKCRHCSVEFESALLRAEHVEMIHRIFCQECNKAFKTNNDLTAHNIKSHGQPLFECATCNEKFTYKTSLYWHIKAHNPAHLYTCKICGHTFKKRYGLKRHALTHDPNSRQKVQCSLCEKVFVSEVYFRKHMQLHTEEQNPKKKYACTVCKYRTNNKNYFTIHLKRHSKMPKQLKVFCEACNLGFFNNIELTTHEIESHQLPPFQCATCDEIFTSKGKLYSHIQLHDPNNSFVCHICGLTYKKKSSFQRHNTRHHSGVDTRVQCFHCEKVLSTREHLRRHMLIHLNQRNFVCTVCGKGFLSKTYLTEHSRIHSGIKPFKCEVCNKAFAQKGSLNIHVRTHTGERPFSCNFCGKGFVMGTLLRYHLKKCSQNDVHLQTTSGTQDEWYSASAATIPVITQLRSFKESVITSVSSKTVSAKQNPQHAEDSNSTSCTSNVIQYKKSQPFSVITSQSFL